MAAPGVVVDVGAFLGWFSLLAASVGCRAHAFEPQERAVALLRQSIASNGFKVRAAWSQPPFAAVMPHPWRESSVGSAFMASTFTRRWCGTQATRSKLGRESTTGVRVCPFLPLHASHRHARSQRALWAAGCRCHASERGRPQGCAVLDSSKSGRPGQPRGAYSTHEGACLHASNPSFPCHPRAVANKVNVVCARMAHRCRWTLKAESGTCWSQQRRCSTSTASRML